MLVKIQTLLTSIGLSPDLQLKIFKSLIALAFLAMMKFITTKILNKRLTKKDSRYRSQKILSYSFYLLFFVLVGRVWYSGIQSIATFFGLIGAGACGSLLKTTSPISPAGFILSGKSPSRWGNESMWETSQGILSISARSSSPS